MKRQTQIWSFHEELGEKKGDSSQLFLPDSVIAYLGYSDQGIVSFCTELFYDFPGMTQLGKDWKQVLLICALMLFHSEVNPSI